MIIQELKGKIPEELIESASKRGISSLTPPQEMAVNAGLLKRKNIVIAAPTASGKTFIAELAMIKSIIWDRKKAIYVAPMRALVSEKFNDFKEAYPYLKAAISIGDLDSLDMWLEKYDMIFVSTEKLDSLIRHGIDWLSLIGTVVIDEVHMIDDAGRGPTLEILMAKLRRLAKDAQIVALSATIGNSAELASWLGAGLVESDFRPVTLEKGVELNGIVHYPEKEEKLLGSHKLPELRITQDTLEKEKQLIIFYSTRRNAESGAEKLSEVTESKSAKNSEDLKRISKEIINVLGRPTDQCEKLARLVSKGVAFHHSGLVNEQRKIIEEAFKANKIKAICSTTTLGLGVNLPAHTVVVRDTHRFDGFGSEKVSVNEVVQLFGRAGRPKYDKYGRALLIARSESEADDLTKRYITASLDEITSKLGALPMLRTHLLAFISTSFLTSTESIAGFLEETFYGYQYSDYSRLRCITEEILDELEKWDFIEREGSRYKPTKLGARISELYLDPLSAKWLVDALPHALDEDSILFIISNTLEMRPHLGVIKGAEDAIIPYMPILRSSEVEYAEDPEKVLSTSMMLKDWISEKSEKDIAIKYRTTPGAIFSKITNADWLLYSTMELARMLKLRTSKMLEVRVRVKYGINGELLDLVRLEQVGRVRARILYTNGFKKVADLRKDGTEEKVSSLLGPELAKKIMAQVRNPSENR